MFGPKAVTIKVEANLTWRVARDAQSGMFVGVCHELNLNALGETWLEFQEVANDAVTTLFLDLFEDNELDGFLSENGWRAEQLPPGRAPEFDVPFNILHLI